MVSRLIVRVALIAMLAACGKSEAPPQDTAPDEVPATSAKAASQARACDILTEADAAKALGRNVTKLDASGGAAGLDICQFGYQGEKLLDMGQVSVTLHAVDLASMKQGVAAQNYAVEPVAGVGDSAFYSKDVGLYVGKGNRTAIYLLGAGGMGDAKERSIALAKDTANRF